MYAYVALFSGFPSALLKGLAWTGVLCAVPPLCAHFGVTSDTFVTMSLLPNGALVASYLYWWHQLRSGNVAASKLAARMCMGVGDCVSIRFLSDDGILCTG